MISVKNLRKEYDSLVAVQDLTFEVSKGQIVGLLGHNGAGKTTVMKVMTGYLEPTSGSVTVGGKDVREDRIGVQEQIGYMPENAPLYDEMLVQEYLLMMAELRGIPKSKRISCVREAIQDTGLTQKVVQPIGTLSKGYRQRVGLAQAILHRPEVLVLDEPTNGLDPVQILEIRSLIRKLAETTTVIVSTHILSEIEAVCNEVVILIDGKLAAHDSLEGLLSAQRVHITFDGSVPNDAVSTLARALNINADMIHFSEEERGLKITCQNAVETSSKVIDLVRRIDWKVTGVAPVAPSLESVFRELMQEHAKQSVSNGGEQ